MKKRISVVVLMGVFISGSVYASGYRIPEQSIDSTAKSGANVASAKHADAAYYNPANMSWMEDAGKIEMDLTYIHLTSIDYTDNRSPFMDGSSKEENFLLPTIFAVSPDYNGLRVGFSVTAPYGLAKRWPDPFPRKLSEKFELKTFDINPTLSYKINEMISVAAGVRMLYSEAEAIMNASPLAYLGIEADSIDWGWNAAVSVKPTKDANFSLTYRSLITLNLEGDANLMADNRLIVMNPHATTDSFPAPAVLTLSGSYTFDKLTVEFTWDRTFWSEYESMDVTFDRADSLWANVFGFPRVKDWDDSSAYRIGFDYAMNEKVNILAGFAYDENPIPDNTLDFVLPDADAYLFSLGTRVKFTDNLELGVSVLYDYKETREISNGVINGEFTNTSAFLVSAGFQYTF